MAMPPLPLPAATYETSVPPQKGERYKSADFRIWIPDDVKRIRGVIVRQHGCGRNGIDHSEDVQWRALAASWNCALLGTHYQHVKECADWWEPANGSERAFLTALAQFSERSRHPELADAPWLLWGHSGGSLWSLSMLNRHPERVLGVIARSASLSEFTPAAYRVPVLFNYGEEEKSGRFESVHRRSFEAFKLGRQKGAPWALAVDPKSGHDCRNSRHFTIRWADAVLGLRLPPADAPTASLRPIGLTDGWLANLELGEAAPPGQYWPSAANANWLPSQSVVKAWMEYCRTGEVADLTPPPPPTNLRVSLASQGVEIAWEAMADLESGLKHFHIFRDGRRIATLGGEVTKTNKAGFYQVWNYGDEPEPRPAPLRHLDREGRLGAKYEVVSENHAGLQSVRK